VLEYWHNIPFWTKWIVRIRFVGSVVLLIIRLASPEGECKELPWRSGRNRVNDQYQTGKSPTNIPVGFLSVFRHLSGSTKHQMTCSSSAHTCVTKSSPSNFQSLWNLCQGE
jgi:hypothetical protein